MRSSALLVLVAAACADETFEIRVVYDTPTSGDDAAPGALDSLELAVARAGSAQDLVSQSFVPGARIELGGVPFADDLVVHLTGRIGGSIVAYGRTCVFAATSGEAPPAPHLWFSRTVKFAPLDVPAAPRTGAWALELGGSMIVAGGSAPAIELFDPRAGTYRDAGALEVRDGAITAPIGSGTPPRAIVVGGSVGTVELVELLPSGELRVDRFADVRAARIAATATALTDGRVVITGGRDPGGAVRGDLLEVAASDAGLELSTVRANLARPRSGHTATRLGDDVGAPVLIAGGADDAGPIGLVELWKPLSGELANPATFAFAMVVPRIGHRAELMPDGSVLFIGGVDAAGAPVRVVERFSIDAGFGSVGELPATTGLVDVTTTALPDGRILIAGGRTTPGGAPVDGAAIARLDVIDGTVDVVETDRLATPRAGHHAATLCDGTVWIGGGTDIGPPAERYEPPPTDRR
jgi:hypothetical protein